ncbi:hypothetical protein Ahy_B08g092838 [Arachis hypogaea]|uniref:MULE transposase domain-containing protein n=1 Tax=Arachis hypogaea TaxID=3818 RepID=A0A444Y4L1_ARAHY|nr:hypothetical protein Ahy_B08g092838 [Arachis hypogaea]
MGLKKTFCAVDDQFVPKVGMTFKTLDDAAKFYKDYSKITDQAQMLKHHRELSMSVCRTIENNEEAGIRPSKTFQSFIAVARGHRELNFIEKDVRNYITREVRNVSEQEDAKEFGKYLLRMKEKNQNFFFELELEDNQSIKLAFWADARSRAVYEYFGDVISFDITYNTNRYNLIYGSFVGVNHHGNTPKWILTDQFASMKRAIEACMPTTIHRWCIWHITKKISSKLNEFKGHTEIQKEMSQVVWNSHTKELFDKNWDDFLLKYGLVDNKWLSELEELTAILHRAYDNVMVEMEELKAKRKGTCSLSHEDANLESVNELQSPPRVRTRGRPKNRLGSKLDKQITNALKKKKTKALNELNLFDAASVVRPNSSPYHGHVMNYQFREPAVGDSFLGV